MGAIGVRISIKIDTANFEIVAAPTLFRNTNSNARLSNFSLDRAHVDHVYLSCVEPCAPDVLTNVTIENWTIYDTLSQSSLFYVTNASLLVDNLLAMDSAVLENTRASTLRCTARGECIAQSLVRCFELE